MGEILALIITTIYGLGFTFLFDINFRKTERIALSILLGFGLQTFLMFIFYLLGFRFTLTNFILELIIVSISLYLACLMLRRGHRIKNFFLSTLHSFVNIKRLLKSISSHDLGTKIFLLFIFGILASSFIIGVYFPVYGWDSLVLYDFRAITFVATGGMEDGIARGYFFGYPLLTSLAHTWIYFFKGNPHLFYWSIYVGFIVIIYENLKSFLSLPTTRLTTLLLATLPFIYTGSFFDYTNFPYLVYLIASILYIIRYSKNENAGFLVISAILVGLSTWVRQTEPFWVVNLLFIFIVLIPSFKKKIKTNTLLILLCVSIFLFLQQPWRLYETQMIGGGRNVGDQAGYAIKSFAAFSIPRFIDVAITTIKGTVTTWSPYLLIAILAAIVSRKNLSKGIVILGFVLANIGLLFVGTYIFSYIWPEDWKAIIDSQQRLSTFIIPLLIIFTAACFDDYILKGERSLRAWLKTTIYDFFKT